MHSTRHLSCILFKPANERQLEKIITEYLPTSILIVYQTDSKRIDVPTIASWPCIKEFTGEINYESIDFTKSTVFSVRKLLNLYGEPHFVAMPLFVGAKFWANVRHFRRNATIINICDGSTENTTILDTFLKLKIKRNKPLTWIKALLVPVLLRFFKADVTFSPCYPYYSSCFSKVTRREAMPRVSEQKRKVIVPLIEQLKPKYLAIDGFELNSEIILKKFGKGSISTSKNKELKVNGHTFALPFYLCTEELLEIFKPQFAVGYPSDALVAVATRYPDVECVAVASEDIRVVWGEFYNKIYEKQVRKFNFRFLRIEEIK